MDVPVDPCAPRWSRCPPPGFRGGPAALAAARTRAVTRVPKSVQRLVAKQPLAGKGRSAALLARIWVRQRLLKRAPGMLAMGRELNAASAARRSCHRRASRHRDRAPRPPRQLPDPAGTGAAAVREPAGRWDRGWSPARAGLERATGAAGGGAGGGLRRARAGAGFTLLPGLTPVVAVVDQPIEPILHPAAEAVDAATGDRATLRPPPRWPRTGAAPRDPFHQLASRLHPAIEALLQRFAFPKRAPLPRGGLARSSRRRWASNESMAATLPALADAVGKLGHGV